MKLGAQVGAGLTLLLVLVFALVGWELLLIERLHEANRRLAGADLEVSRTSLRMRLEIDRLTDLTERYFVLRDPGYRAELGRLRGRAAEDLDHLRGLPLGVEERNSLNPLAHLWREYRARADEVEAVVPSGGEAREARQRLLADLAQMRRQVAQLDQEAVERVSVRIVESTSRAAEARRVAVLVGAGGLLLALLVALWISRTTVRPLRALARASRTVTRGRFDHRVPERGPAEVVSLARDFNEMLRQLGELDQMKSDFLSSVSHDLKAPLASMQETTRLLLEDETLGGEQRRLLTLHEECSQRLQRMIGDLLDVARLEAGAVDFELEPLDLVGCCRQVVAEAEGLLEAGEVRVESDWPDLPVLVRADSRLLMQALWNLMSNAAKFSPRGGVIRITVCRVDDGEQVPAGAPRPSAPAAVLSISDQGPGIPDDEKGRVFERFYRSGGHAGRASGTGLGLTVARSIVTGLGGRVWVEDAAGGGSLFAVLLPVLPEEPPSTPTR